MLISVFTPTHNPTWLGEVYQSLRDQTVDGWEWVIVVNNSATRDRLPAEVVADVRVRIFEHDSTVIGALKNFACRMAVGDILVELDHDDWLTPTCLEEILKAHRKEPAGFYYSDFLHLRDNGEAVVYPEAQGWETVPLLWRGKTYPAMRAFDVSARTLCEIYWAPDHVRAWSRAAYEASGGHDTRLAVGDDQDLLCRTYLAKVPFVHIREPLYVYRVHQNTVFLKNPEIQAQAATNRDRYIHDLIREDCRRADLAMVDISAAPARQAGMQGLDHDGEAFAAIPHGTVGLVRCHDLLNLLPRDKIVPLFNAVYDRLAPGGWFISATPAIDDGEGRIGRGAFQNPMAASFWSQNNFYYFTRRQYADYLPDYRGRFQGVRIWTNYPTPAYRADQVPYLWADLYALKGQRSPGPRYI